MYAVTFLTRRVGTLLCTVAAGATLVQCAAPVPRRAIEPSPPAVSGPVTRPAAVPSEPVTAAELGASWRPGCPVEPGQLRRVHLQYLGFDGTTHRGELIVNQDVAQEVVEIFEQLRRIGFPIDKMRTVERYRAADDELSMEDDNTSAFNCRGIPGTTRWSEHAYGWAIDINPLLNPCLHASGLLEPRTAEAYLDRGRTDPGLLHHGDPAVRIFLDRGWHWGGDWTDPIDYQHFERP